MKQPSPKLQAHLRVEALESAVFEAVHPDNRTLPEGLSIHALRKEQVTEFLIECTRGLRSLIATLDDLLEALQVAERTLRAVK
ncbi:hypothetical protein DRN94_000620 [archaeon]|nr:hypothetical protein [archaeon]